MRTLAIALVAGAVAARCWGGLARWPTATLLMLWPSFGGHWVEVWFLNWLRPHIPAARAVQIATRLVVWFLGGAAFITGMACTAAAVTRSRPARLPAWWIGGLAFIGIELIAHLGLRLRGRPSFYDGRG